MSFLNPGYLWLLPLLTIPVIIHLLAKRKSKLIEFPSLKFLRQLEQDALKKFNLKQLLLLILRTLMILLIILAFSRPNLNFGSGMGLSLGSNSLALIIMDNTASTSDQFDELSGPWVKNLTDRLDEKGYALKYADLENLDVVDDIGHITKGYGAAYPADPLQRIEEQIQLEPYTDKVLIWLGDGQDLGSFAEKFLGWDMYSLSVPRGEDFGIRDVELPKTGLQMGQEYMLDIGLSSRSDSEIGQGLELLINDERQNQRLVEAGESNIQMTAQVKEPGFQIGSVQVAEDQYAFNDNRYFVIPAQGKTPFQILRRVRSVDYWSVIRSALESQSNNLDISLLDIEDVDDLDLGRGGTVVVENASLLADYSWGRLKGFVERGGQLLAFGDGGAHLTDLLGLSTPLQPENTTSSMVMRMTRSGQDIGLPEPLTEVLLTNRLKVYSRYLTGGSELGATWIRYADSEPFLGASEFGEGRVIWFNTDFDRRGGNIALLGVFPALMLHFGQSSLNRDQTAGYNYLIGDTLQFQPEMGNSAEPFSIARPDGTTDYASPDSNYVIRYSNTGVPGIYTLNKGRRVIEPVAVNISPREVAPVPTSDLSDKNLVFQTSEQDLLVKEILENRTGLPLWPILLTLLLLTWMMETYLSRIIKTWRNND